MLGVVLIVVATVAAYLSSFQGAMVLDDPLSIKNNATIRKLWPPGAALSPPRDGSPVQGRPVVNLSLAVNYAMGGTGLWGYHATNLLIHLLAALTLFGIARRTFARECSPPRMKALSLPLATAIALLWALHPLQTESVTYLSQRAESLMGLFFLLTLYCAIRSATGGRPALWTAAAVAACLAGMASKEVMVAAPLLVLLYDRAFLAGSFAGALRRRWSLYAGLAATWAILAWLVIGAGDRAGSAGTAGAAWNVTPWDYACTQFGAIVGYLGQALRPSKLVFGYGTSLAKGPWEIVPYAVVIGLLFLATAVATVRWKPWGFLGAWFFAILAPSSSVVPIVLQTKAEHRMYLPLAAVVTAVVLVVWRLGETLLGRWVQADEDRPRWGWALAAAGTAIVATALGVATFQRNHAYVSEEVLWKDTLAKCPDNALALTNLGHLRSVRGDRAGAIRHFDQAIRFDPLNLTAYYDRGNDRFALGQFEQAVQDFTKVIERKPSFMPAYNNRAAAYLRLGQNAGALRDCDKVIESEANHTNAYQNRAWARYRLGEIHGARADLAKVEQLGGRANPELVRLVTTASAPTK